MSPTSVQTLISAGFFFLSGWCYIWLTPSVVQKEFEMAYKKYSQFSMTFKNDKEMMSSGE